MLVRALGPVELRAGGKVVGPGGPKPKALLAALTVNLRQVVSIDRLVGLVWDEDPPSSASALVHQYISQIRRSFAAAGAKDVLTTHAPGYLLRLDAETKVSFPPAFGCALRGRVAGSRAGNASANSASRRGEGGESPAGRCR